MKWIKTLLLLPLVAAISVAVLVIVTVLYLGALLVGTGWRLVDAARRGRRKSVPEGRGRSAKGDDEPWELLP